MPSNVSKPLLKNKKVGFILRLILLGLVNSILFSCLLLLVNSGISVQEQSRGRISLLGFLFVSVGVISFFCRRLFQTSLIKVTHSLLLDYETSMVKRIAEVDYASFLKIHQPGVYAALNDIKIISQLPRFFVDIMNNAIVVLVSIIYLLTISPLAAISVILLVGGLSAFYAIRNGQLGRQLDQGRSLEDTYYGYLGDLLSGFREIKMDNKKMHAIYHSYIKSNRQNLRQLEIKASVLYMNNELTGNYTLFAILGIVVFVLGYFLAFSTTGITNFVIIILYLMGPVSMIIGSLPFVTRIRVSMQRLKAFEKSIPQGVDCLGEEHASTPAALEIRTLGLKQVAFVYPSNRHDQAGFALGPLTVDFSRGEVIFITGANGSGKSTFLFLLTGLLIPQQGQLMLNGKVLSGDQYQSFKENFSVVFVDNYLFSENYAAVHLESAGEATRTVIDMLGIDPAVIKDPKLRDQLSKGQKKRLALINALLEEKPVLILDEWAAEQDPQFRAYFYNNIIPALKRTGRTIIAVTHDDKYFPAADRIIHFQEGRVVERLHTSPTLVLNEA